MTRFVQLVAELFRRFFRLVTRLIRRMTRLPSRIVCVLLAILARTSSECNHRYHAN